MLMFMVLIIAIKLSVLIWTKPSGCKYHLGCIERRKPRWCKATRSERKQPERKFTLLNKILLNLAVDLIDTVADSDMHVNPIRMNDGNPCLPPCHKGGNNCIIVLIGARTSPMSHCESQIRYKLIRKIRKNSILNTLAYSYQASVWIGLFFCCRSNCCCVLDQPDSLMSSKKARQFCYWYTILNLRVRQFSFFEWSWIKLRPDWRRCCRQICAWRWRWSS